jgi:hypothetical protein
MGVPPQPLVPMLAKVNSAAHISAVSKKCVETRSELGKVVLKSTEQAESCGNNSIPVIGSFQVEQSFCKREFLHESVFAFEAESERSN